MPPLPCPAPAALVEKPRGESRPLSWLRQLGLRLKTDWPLKFVSSVGFTGLFFLGYFFLLKYPLFKAVAMPVLAADHWIPFQPGALTLYASLWLYVQLPPAFLLRRVDLVAYGKALIALTLVGFAVFFFFPTTLPVSSIDWTQHTAFQTLKEVDASGNACPSLHVAFGLFTALSLSQSFRAIGAPRLIHAVNALWCLGIIYSTLATRQHVILDVLGGALLALLVWQWYQHLLRTTSTDLPRSPSRF